MAIKRTHVKGVYLELLLAHISRQGGIVSLRDAYALYTKEVVDEAIKQAKVTTITIRAEDKTLRSPPQRISAIYTKQWNRERPTWLDAYIHR